MENPFSEMYEIMAQSTHIPSSIHMGTVSSVIPLKVKFEGIEIDNKNLKVNSVLKTKNEYVDFTLKKGDTVLMIQHGEKYIVVCKVVS